MSIDPFRKLPGFTRSAPGLEHAILRRLPTILVAGTLLVALPSLLGRVLFGDAGSDPFRLMTVDLYVIGMVLLHWSAVLTVGIGAVIVMVMKGPAYVADAYPLVEVASADEPGRRR